MDMGWVTICNGCWMLLPSHWFKMKSAILGSDEIHFEKCPFGHWWLMVSDGQWYGIGLAGLMETPCFFPLSFWITGVWKNVRLRHRPSAPITVGTFDTFWQVRTSVQFREMLGVVLKVPRQRCGQWVMSCDCCDAFFLLLWDLVDPGSGEGLRLADQWWKFDTYHIGYIGGFYTTLVRYASNE